MHKNPGAFADLLNAAARRIGEKHLHPGQTLPGVWPLGGEMTPERVIGVVAAKALQEECAARGLSFEAAMESYVEASRNVALRPIGGPDVMARNHLEDAAYELRRQAEPLRLVC